MSYTPYVPYLVDLNKEPSSMFEAGIIVGRLEYKLNEKLRQIRIFSYIRMKFELHAVRWDACSLETNFVIQDSDVPENLYNQTQEDFKYYWQKWYRVLTNSKAPGAQRFLQEMRIAFKGCSVEDISKQVALLMCYLINQRYNSVAFKEFEVFTDVEKLMNALKELNMIDQDLLTVIRILEETTATDDP